MAVTSNEICSRTHLVRRFLCLRNEEGSIPFESAIMERSMNEHVEYEYVMMNEVARMWDDPSGGINAQVFNNMCNMVAYLTAQNLIWYIADEVDIPSDIQDLLSKIDVQIMCLSPSSRTSEMNEKLQPSDFAKLKSFIEANKDKLNNGD